MLCVYCLDNLKLVSLLKVFRLCIVVVAYLLINLILSYLNDFVVMENEYFNLNVLVFLFLGCFNFNNYKLH